MNFEEKKTDSKQIYDGRILKLKKDAVILPNGKEGVREVIVHNGGSAILCVKDGKILLVKQFRYPFNEEIYEIPAGKINEGEKPIDTARRELEEEAGLKAKSVKLIFKTYPTPAYDTEIIYIYEAEDIYDSVQHLDEDEFLTASWFTFDEINKMLENGIIKDGKTLIAILYALKKYS